MSSTATISWNNQTSGTQELYYGADSLVSGLPGTGGGWTPYSGNPIAPSIGSVTLNNLSDNVKYQFLVRADCANSNNIYSKSSGIKWVCGSVQAQSPVNGILSYTLNVDPSVSNPGSAAGRIAVSLIGVDSNNNAVIAKHNYYQAPYQLSYTDQFTGVIGNVTWSLKVSYDQSAYPYTKLHECSSQLITTTVPTGSTTIHVRNALASGVLSQLFLQGGPQSVGSLDAGYGANLDITSLQTVGAPLQASVTLIGIPSGTQLIARQIRGGAQIAGGLFTYVGAMSNISSVPWTLQQGDTIQVSDSATLGYIYRQPLITKLNGEYSFSFDMDVTQGSATAITITARAYDYGTGATEAITSGTITLAQGQTQSSVSTANTTLSPSQYATATITDIIVTTPGSSIAVPYSYTL